MLLHICDILKMIIFRKNRSIPHSFSENLDVDVFEIPMPFRFDSINS